MANLDWRCRFPSYFMSHITHSFSNHCLLLLDTLGCQNGKTQRREFSFRFNVEWKLEEDFEEQVKMAWSLNNVDIVEKHVLLSVSLKG